MIHFYLSLILIALLTIQAAFGSMLGIKIKRTKKTAAIPSLTKFHLVLGTTIDIIIKFQTANGLYMFNANYMIYLFAYYGILLALRGYQEYSYYFRSKIRGNMKIIDTKENSKIEIHQKLLTLLNNSSI